MIQKRQLNKFLENYIETFGIELTELEAEEAASRLITLYQAVYGDPIYGINHSNENEK